MVFASLALISTAFVFPLWVKIIINIFYTNINNFVCYAEMGIVQYFEQTHENTGFVTKLIFHLSKFMVFTIFLNK